MPYSVTSWFMDQTVERSPDVARKFTIGASDYSDRVLRWPRLRRNHNDIRPVEISIDLANEDQDLNIFKADKTLLRADCQVQIGFTHPQSGDEFITVHQGRVSRVKYQGGVANLTIRDKIKDFTERTIGTSDLPVTFTDTDYLPSEIAWTLCTCYGGLVDSRDNANADIDFANFSAWAGIWSGDNVFLKARFDGMKVNDALRRLGKMTHSAIYLENNKLEFFRFAEADSHETLLDADRIGDLTLEIDDAKIVNKQIVLADYDVNSRFHKITTIAQDTASVNSFGVREDIVRDETIWYTGSATALNLAQRLVDFGANPYEKYVIEGPLVPIARQIGETVRLVDSHLGVDSSSTWRLMDYEFDLDRGRSRLQVDGSQIYFPFTLDDDVLGLLDGQINRLL